MKSILFFPSFFPKSVPFSLPNEILKFHLKFLLFFPPFYFSQTILPYPDSLYFSPQFTQIDSPLHLRRQLTSVSSSRYAIKYTERGPKDLQNLREEIQSKKRKRTPKDED
ncbi:hypothetical protein ERO13_A07G037500v2 [Gossypium hirsutum]|nr:hypothetical protein ERO13_A07G037500v2 [Gossypium hirsutum]